MATKYWDGGGAAGDFGAAANWSDDAAPANNDVLILSSNSEAITGAAVSGDNMDLVVGPGWTGNIGTTGTELEADFDNIDYSGKALAVYIDPTQAVTAINISDTGPGDTALVIRGTTTVTNLRCTGGSGTVTFGTSRTITTVEMIGASGLTLDLASGTVVGTTLRMDAGICKIDAAFTNVEVFGGTLEITGNPTIATLDIYGGTVKYNVSGSTAAISTRLAVYGGTFDASGVTGSAATITGAEMYDAGTIDERSGLETITWSGGIAVHGGTLRLDPGRTVTVA